MANLALEKDFNILNVNLLEYSCWKKETAQLSLFFYAILRGRRLALETAQLSLFFYLDFEFIGM